MLQVTVGVIREFGHLILCACYFPQTAQRIEFLLACLREHVTGIKDFFLGAVACGIEGITYRIAETVGNVRQAMCIVIRIVQIAAIRAGQMD